MGSYESTWFKKRTNKTKYRIDTKGPPLSINSIKEGYILNKRISMLNNMDAGPKKKVQTGPIAFSSGFSLGFR